jgi:hypothetical protein
MSQISCWVCADLYQSYYDSISKISGTTIYSFLGAILASWLISTFLFFYKIKRQYWSTFYSLVSGRQNTMSYFLDNDDDATKRLVFDDSPDLWTEIRDKVKEWTLSRWNVWEAEKPSWFTEAFKESVPDEFIPKVVLEKMNQMAGGKRRRSSAGLAPGV